VISYTKVFAAMDGGLRLLKEAGTLCWFSGSLISLAVRLQRDPEPYETVDNLTNLLWRVIYHRHDGPKRRWSILLTSPQNILSSGELNAGADIEQIGCMNFQSCPQRIQLVQIRQRMLSETLAVRSSSTLAEKLTEEEIAFIVGFGSNLSYCRA
jgi:hypothetical protein